LLRRYAPRNDDNQNPNTASPSRGIICPKFCTNLVPRERGRRECRVRAAPAVSCAKCTSKTHTSIQVQRKHSGIPHAMALRLMARSPRRRILIVTVAAGLMVNPIRLDRIRHRQLDTSNGCRNHTLLPYAATRRCQMASPGKAPFVCAPVDRSRKTALRSRSRRRCRVHRIPPYVRDDGQRPSFRTGPHRYIADLGTSSSEISENQKF
jgi:hypothetical protein